MIFSAVIYCRGSLLVRTLVTILSVAGRSAHLFVNSLLASLTLKGIWGVLGNKSKALIRNLPHRSLF